MMKTKKWRKIKSLIKSHQGVNGGLVDASIAASSTDNQVAAYLDQVS